MPSVMPRHNQPPQQWCAETAADLAAWNELLLALLPLALLPLALLLPLVVALAACASHSPASLAAGVPLLPALQQAAALTVAIAAVLVAAAG